MAKRNRGFYSFSFCLVFLFSLVGIAQCDTALANVAIGLISLPAGVHPSGMIFKSSSGRYNACNFSGSMSRRCNHVSHLDAGGFLTKV